MENSNTSQTKFYTGVGSRETPLVIQKIMFLLARKYGKLGYVGRSGSAEGADLAFETGAISVGAGFHSYLPWSGFNKKYPDNRHILVTDSGLLQKAESIVRSIHPCYDKLSRGAKTLHTRNVFQVLGHDLNTPSEFLVCYSKPTNKGLSGGTNTAWMLALRHGIPCYNLWHRFDCESIVNL